MAGSGGLADLPPFAQAGNIHLLVEGGIQIADPVGVAEGGESSAACTATGSGRMGEIVLFVISRHLNYCAFVESSNEVSLLIDTSPGGSSSFIEIRAAQLPLSDGFPHF